MRKIILLSLSLLVILLRVSIADEFDVTEIPTDTTVVGANQKNDDDPLYVFNKVIYYSYKIPYDYGIKYVAEAIVRLPTYSKDRLRDFANNGREPIYMVNHFLQLRINSGLESFFRFTINTTIGIFGFWDVTSSLGLPMKKNDFGATMYFYNVPSGPYVFLIGPSNLRDTIGMVPGYYTDIFYTQLFSPIKELDIQYKGKSLIKISPYTIINGGFYLEDYRNHENSFYGFDEYFLIKTIYTNFREQELQMISTYD